MSSYGGADIVQVERVSKGKVVTAHNAIADTATSEEINASGFNALLVSIFIDGTGTWKIDVQGKLKSDGTFMDIYDNYGIQLTTGNITESIMRLFAGAPNHIKIVATEVDGTATVTVKVQPVNI